MPLNLNSQFSHPDDLLLEEARMAASSDWEESFVGDQLERRAKYGGTFQLTKAQRAKLEEIAYGKDEDGDLFARQSRWGRKVMQIGRIEGCTRVLGKSQGYLGLPIRDEVIAEVVSGPETPCMVTAWLPTPEELTALNAGAAVHVRIIGQRHPPIMVDVGEPPAAI